MEGNALKPFDKFRKRMPLKASPFFSSLFTSSSPGHGGAKATRLLLLLRYFSCPATTAAAAHDSTVKPGFIVEYLVASCGFSPAEALTLGKRVDRVKSRERPDAVRRFLEGLGFHRPQIKALIRWEPRILTANVEKTLKSKVQNIRDLGFVGPEVAEVIAANPSALRITKIVPKIEFLRSLLTQRDDLLKALRRDPTLLTCNPEETIVPNYALLRKCGVPDERITRALVALPRLLTRKADYFKELVDRTASFGIDCSSGMFLYGLHAMNCLSKETLETKRRFMKSFGWSEEDFLTAFRKAPSFLSQSEERLGASMSFLLQEVGCEAGYVATHPTLLLLSFERRLAPRLRARQILKSEGLPGGAKALLTLVCMPEEKFWNTYVVPHICKLPALREIYQAACAKSSQREETMASSAWRRRKPMVEIPS